jgi:RecB family exonuclease
MLHDVADRLMASAPARLRFRVSPQWAQEQQVLRRKLERLIRDDFLGINPLNKQFGGALREIYRQEVPFGGDGSFSIDLGAERLRLRGLVDRIDRQGDRAIVVDYKSGSTPFRKTEIEQGRNFQMMIYLLAAQALLEQDTAPDAPHEVAGGVFWQIGGASLGDLAADEVDIIDAGRDHLSRYLERARQGDFAAHANKLQDGKCASYCDFHQFCRASITSRRKR